MMKLMDAKGDDLVTVMFGAERVAVAEARELKAAGFGQRKVTQGCLGEWTLLARSHPDFLQLTRAIPQEYVL